MTPNVEPAEREADDGQVEQEALRRLLHEKSLEILAACIKAGVPDSPFRVQANLDGVRVKLLVETVDSPELSELNAGERKTSSPHTPSCSLRRRATPRPARRSFAAAGLKMQSSYSRAALADLW